MPSRESSLGLAATKGMAAAARATFTDLTSPHDGTRSAQEIGVERTVETYVQRTLPLGGVTHEEEKELRRLERAERRWEMNEQRERAERQVSMLVEVPGQVREGDEVFQLWLDGFASGRKIVPLGLLAPGTGSQPRSWNDFRLKWWGDTHPGTRAGVGASTAPSAAAAAGVT